MKETTMRKSKTIVAILAMLATAAAASAQGGPGGPGPRDRLREDISTLYLVRLTQALDLTQEQAARIFPILTKAEKEKGDLQRRMGSDVMALRDALDREGVKEADLTSLVGRIQEARRLIRAKDEEIEAFMDKNLDPVQKAKYVLFSIEFFRRMNDSIDRARRKLGPM